MFVEISYGTEGVFWGVVRFCLLDRYLIYVVLLIS